jgi:hypothetical protein
MAGLLLSLFAFAMSVDQRFLACLTYPAILVNDYGAGSDRITLKPSQRDLILNFH